MIARTYHLYVEDNCGTHAAAIAFYALFSLVPLALIVLSFVGMLIDRQEIVNFVFDQIPLEETSTVRANVDELVSRAQEISPAGLSFGLLALIWAGGGVFGAVRRGLNAASHRQRSRPYWHGKLVDFALIPGLGALILLSITLTAATQTTIDWTGQAGPFDVNTSMAVRLVSFLLTMLVSLTMFSLLYHFVPTTRPPWGETLTGAIFASVGFELLKTAGAILVSVAPFSRNTAIYAGFSTAFVFLFWTFLSASILLMGAEFSRAVSEQRAGRQMA